MIEKYHPKDLKGNSCGQLIVQSLKKRYNPLCSWFEGYKGVDCNTVFDVDGIAVYASDKIDSEVKICGTNKEEIDKTKKTIETLFQNLNYPIKLEQ